MNNVNLSVIIPAYNAENTIVECIESVLSQHLDNMEIIIIDDGSTDCTVELCECYKKKYEFIRLFQQKIKGLDVQEILD